MPDGTSEQNDAIARAAGGDVAAWGTLLMEHEPRLTRMVAFRLDPRLRGRIDPADVVQEAFVEAAEHRDDYFAQAQTTPLFLWLRGVVGNKMLEIHRRHLATRMRNIGREVPLEGNGNTNANGEHTSAAVLANLTGHLTRPSVAAVRGEAYERVRAALAAMEPTDREVLALRHFEQLTSAETAAVLGIQERAAAKRYLRALKRLREMLAELPGGLTGLRP